MCVVRAPAMASSALHLPLAQLPLLPLGIPRSLPVKNGLAARRGRSAGDVSASAKAAEPREASGRQERTPNPGLVHTWFDDAFQYTAWPVVHKLLTERKVESVGLQEAYDLAESGAATLIDVREAQDYEKVHARESFSAPLFRLIQGSDLKANLRRLGNALITQFAGTERNPDFVNQALQAVNGDKDKLVILICDIGGTVSTIVERTGPKAKKYADPERRFGRASRSLRGVFELQEAGFSKVAHLSGGLNSWLHHRFPVDGSRVN